jgi:hypothetical protein
MTDRHSVYTKVLQTLKSRLKMYRQGHVVTLAMMITGIVMSRKAQLAVMSEVVPTATKGTAGSAGRVLERCART